MKEKIVKCNSLFLSDRYKYMIGKSNSNINGTNILTELLCLYRRAANVRHSNKLLWKFIDKSPEKTYNQIKGLQASFHTFCMGTSPCAEVLK